MIKPLEPMQIVKVPGGGGTLPIDFNRKRGLVPASITGRFKQCRGSVGESAKKRAGIIDLHRFNLPRQVMFPLPDKGLGHGGNFDDRSIQPKRHVDVVGKQVAGDAAPGDRAIQSPQAFTALRKILRNGPILQKLGAIVKDAPETILTEQLLQ